MLQERQDYKSKALVVYLPNLISIFRLFLTPFLIWLIVSDRLLTAFLVFLVAGISDALDGFLARQFRWQTELGRYLDPLADKALLVSIYIALGLFGHLPAWLVIAVVSRDVLIVGAVLLAWLLARPVEVKPLAVSKANTAGQIALATLVLADRGLALGFAQTIAVLTWIVGALTVSSAASYLVFWLKHMARYEPSQRRLR